MTDNAEGTFVVVALLDENGLGEEDVQLLEMLVAHIATALDRVHGGQIRTSNSS
ncbi:hypothetical protein [Halovenus salina]|uniref:hypothetical protein n=1 Tax=Halovenus salina TaxID=1510225 RepID=UPI0036D32FF4